jgi:uncharacterized cofD-like protein
VKKVVVIGGGTGSFTILSALKNYNLDLSAVVSMADDGGSTGVLRDELGVLPPGDVRQCLVALSNSSRLMRSLMNYRFENGGLGGHNFGNILLSTLEKVTGSFEKAIEEAGRILSIKGKVLPITTNPVRLHMILNNDRLLRGEKEILLSKDSLIGFKNIYLEPFPKANHHAIDEIMNADLIIFGPGGLYTSLIPTLLVGGISKSLRETQAKKVFLVNLMNKKRQTPGFKASDYVNEIKRFIGEDVFNHIFINNKVPNEDLITFYSNESELVENNLHNDDRVVATDLISDEKSKFSRGDVIANTRALIRHDQKKIAKEIMKILNVM